MIPEFPAGTAATVEGLLSVWWAAVNALTATWPDADASWSADGETELKALALLARKYPGVLEKWAETTQTLIGQLAEAGKRERVIVLEHAAGSGRTHFPTSSAHVHTAGSATAHVHHVYPANLAPGRPRRKGPDGD